MIGRIEGKKIFRNNKERDDFIERLETLCPEMQITCYAWELRESGIPHTVLAKKLELSRRNINVSVERREMIAKAGNYSLGQ